MKKLSFAAALALGFFALARADEGAFKTLAGMAQAAPQAGPEADDAPTDAAPKMGTLRDAIADVPTPRPGGARAAARASSAGPAAPAAPAARKPAAVSAPAASLAAPAARLWTRLYSTLLPSPHPAELRSSFEAPVSTGTAARRSTPPTRAPLSALMPPPDSEAVSAGERRGMAELMSVSDPAAQ